MSDDVFIVCLNCLLFYKTVSVIDPSYAMQFQLPVLRYENLSEYSMANYKMAASNKRRLIWKSAKKAALKW